MTSPADEHKTLSPQDVEDAEFGKRLATYFAPSPLTPNKWAAFDMALETRIEKRRQRTFFVPAFATVAAAVGVLVFSLNGGIRLNSQTPSSSEPPLIVAESSLAEASDEWEYDLLVFNNPMAYVDESNERNELDETQETADMYAADDNEEEEEEETDTDVFPDEYLAIERIFLEG